MSASILASSIALCNGSAWSALGSGGAPGTVLNPHVVRALAFHDDALQILTTTNLTVPFTTLAGPIASGGATTRFTNSTTPDPIRFFRVAQLPP